MKPIFFENTEVLKERRFGSFKPQAFAQICWIAVTYQDPATLRFMDPCRMLIIPREDVLEYPVHFVFLLPLTSFEQIRGDVRFLSILGNVVLEVPGENSIGGSEPVQNNYYMLDIENAFFSFYK